MEKLSEELFNALNNLYVYFIGEGNKDHEDAIRFLKKGTEEFIHTIDLRGKHRERKNSQNP